ncbi:Uncharacterised protein [Paucimonas lemoignei]|nr:Uncharacterised protein [Paucimonas lemoignei]
MGTDLCEFIREEASTVDASSSTLTLPSRMNSLSQELRQPEVTYPSTCPHCLLKRLSDTGILVPSCWANSETRYSSSHQR